MNISCPNVKEGGMNFGIKTEVARYLVRQVRKHCKHKLVVKLSPNAEDIVELAKMYEEERADGVEKYLEDNNIDSVEGIIGII